MKRHFPLLSILCLAACTALQEAPAAEGETVIRLITAPPLTTRSADPDETLVSDVNLFLFNDRGVLEDRVFLTGRQLERTAEGFSFRQKLIPGVPYDIYVCANFGYPLALSTKEELEAYRYPLIYPDEFTQGLPMTACGERIVAEDGPVRLYLERMVSKISLRIDRTALNPDVRLMVRRVSIGGCPRSALLFRESRAETAEDVFLKGFEKTYPDCDPLNRDVTLGISRECSVYMLESLQGDVLREPVCPYIEIESEYYSDVYYSGGGQYLVYRFYIGTRPGNYDIRRNCHYHITVRPEGDGLHGNSWSVDLEHLGILEDAKVFDLFPAAYNECRSGDDFHFRVEVFPPWTKVTFDKEWLEDERHLYSYTLDEDGLGITLHTRKGGTAMLYISAGAPVYRDTLALLVIDP